MTAPPVEKSQSRSNYEAYVENYQAELEQTHFGKVVLLHDREIVKVFDDWDNALSIGYKRYGSGNFSVQEIGARPISLGIRSAFG